jgi:hypothetical protein
VGAFDGQLDAVQRRERAEALAESFDEDRRRG